MILVGILLRHFQIVKRTLPNIDYHEQLTLSGKEVLQTNKRKNTHTRYGHNYTYKGNARVTPPGGIHRIPTLKSTHQKVN